MLCWLLCGKLFRNECLTASRRVWCKLALVWVNVAHVLFCYCLLLHCQRTFWPFPCGYCCCCYLLNLSVSEFCLIVCCYCGCFLALYICHSSYNTLLRDLLFFSNKIFRSAKIKRDALALCLFNNKMNAKGSVFLYCSRRMLSKCKR